jgi:CheY-like chemotaxis protein
MDGYQFIREVRTLPPHHGGRTPAVALTSLNRLEDRARAIDAGFQCHLVKPFEIDLLIDILGSFAGKMQ